MKTNILLMTAFCTCSICLAQEQVDKDSIQIYYCRTSGDLIGGENDHCVTIYFEDDTYQLKRICYKSSPTNMRTYLNEYLSCCEESEKQDIFPPPIPSPFCYYKSQRYAILRHYQESYNYLVLDERVEISKSQFDELVKIINEIKAFGHKNPDNEDEIVISTGGSSHYVIKDKSGTSVIVDWLGRYNRRWDIEKALGLKSYSRCPCVEVDLKQMNNNRNSRRRFFR